MANKRFIRLKYGLLFTILANNVLIATNLSSSEHSLAIKDVCSHFNFNACQEIFNIVFWTLTATVLILNHLAHTGVSQENYNLILTMTIALSLTFLILAFRLVAQFTFYNVFKALFILFEACLSSYLIKFVMVNNERRRSYVELN